MYFMSDPQALHVTRNVIPGKLGVDLHLHRVHIPLVAANFRKSEPVTRNKRLPGTNVYAKLGRSTVLYRSATLFIFEGVRTVLFTVLFWYRDTTSTAVLPHVITHYSRSIATMYAPFESELTMGQWVMGQMGQQICVGHVGHGSLPVTRWPILHCTHPVSRVIFLFMENQQRHSKLLFRLSVIVTFHNLCNSVARDEQTTLETHRFPWEDPNAVEILEKKD